MHFLKEISDLWDTRVLEPREILIRKWDPKSQHELYIVEEWMLLERWTSLDWTKQNIHELFGIWDICNPQILYSNSSKNPLFMSQVEALPKSNSVVRSISGHKMQQLMGETPQVLEAVFSYVWDKISSQKRKVEDMNFLSSKERIRDLIVLLAEKVGKKFWFDTEIKIPLVHSDFAQMTWTSRQTVTSFLSELRNNKIIRTSRWRILIHDLDALIKREV